MTESEDNAIRIAQAIKQAGLPAGRIPMTERLTTQGNRVIRMPQNIVESDIPQWISDLEREIVRLRERVQALEDAQSPPGDMRPSERIAALERELQLTRQELEELKR